MFTGRKTRRPDPSLVGIRVITFGSPGHPADHCTYAGAPAEFMLCIDCPYNRGASGTGIKCGHRFGIDPTLIDGRPTQIQNGDIIEL
ncbi:MAG: hypothetical protein NVS4B8_25740 [Herpetosiphon sp.]